jgi:hypothetical protein
MGNLCPHGNGTSGHRRLTTAGPFSILRLQQTLCAASHVMPSPTSASALIQLHKNNNAPWEWETWKSITGIRDGLFPTDDTKLPRGLSRRDSDDILSYFTAFNALPSEGAKFKLAAGRGGVKTPGRQTWHTFVRKNYNKWGINGIIIQALNRANAHPVKQMLGENNLDVWPSSEHLLPQALNEIGLALFGNEAINQDTDNIHNFLRAPTQHIAQNTWSNLNKQFTRDRKNMSEYEDAAKKAFEGAYPHSRRSLR